MRQRTGRNGQLAPGGARSALALATATAASASLLTAPAVAAAAAGPVTAEVPVAGTARWSLRADEDEGAVVAVVHAVRRVEGGTAVYWSLGVPEGSDPVMTMTAAFPSPQFDDYGLSDAWRVPAVDTEGLRGYQPLIGSDGCLCSDLNDLSGEPGRLDVAYAVLPELPPDVESVDVSLAFGATVTDVPVGEGPLEPLAGGAEPPRVGEGWPELPDVTAAGVADPGAYSFDLVRQTSDLAGEVATSVQPDQVEVAVDAEVLFAVDSAELGPRAEAVLADVASRVGEDATGAVSVVGHTDDNGDDAYNDDLSQRRAEAVAEALRRLAPGAEVTAEGRGESEPVADNSTEEGRQQNRRVTITYATEERP